MRDNLLIKIYSRGNKLRTTTTTTTSVAVATTAVTAANISDSNSDEIHIDSCGAPKEYTQRLILQKKIERKKK